MKTLSFTLLVSFVLCLYAGAQNNVGTPPILLVELKKEKAVIDKYLVKHSPEVVLLAKRIGRKQLVIIGRNKWPDDTECSYNVLKDKEGHIICIIKSPVSESGDWDLTITHYFDPKGQTFAREIQANAFSLPNEGVAYETTTDFFDQQFKKLSHRYQLVDKKKRKLSKEYAFDRPALDLKIYPTVTACLEAYHISLK